MISRTAPAPPGATLHPGQKVYLSTLSREGEVVAPAGPDEKEAEVLVGGMKLRVPRDQVRIFAAARDAVPAPSKGTPRRGEESAAAVYLQTPGNTLDLRGMYVDDALPEVDVFLDRQALAQAPPAFLIPGHGTGGVK